MKTKHMWKTSPENSQAGFSSGLYTGPHCADSRAVPGPVFAKTACC